MSRSATVAVVRSDNRRGAVAQALALIADDLRARVTADVLIKPHIENHRQRFSSTHADTLSATLDAVIAAGAARVIVGEGASDASAGFDRLGFRKEVVGRPVAFLDLDLQETSWTTVELTSVEGRPLRARVSRTIAESPCRISLATARTHFASMLTLGLDNMRSSVHPDDRLLIHGLDGHDSGRLDREWPAIGFQDGDHLAAQLLTRIRGRLRNLRAILSGKAREYSGRRFNRAERNTLRAVGALNRNLVRLAGVVKPQISVVDGFVATHREGPRHGSPIRLGTVIAGIDAVAVDAVAAAVMRFDPNQIGYLRLAQEAGLGVADLDAIHVVGDPIAAVRRVCVPHSNFALQRHWDHLVDLPEPTRPESAWPAPHVAVTRSSEPAHR